MTTTKPTTDNKVYTAFINKGEVPVNAFKLLGASNKRGDDSKIGFFGSGLKYSMAVLLREGVEFRVFSGLKEIKVGTRTTEFLDQKIQVITINGEKTSITLDAGTNWEPWFAIRELYSNALDEGGSIETETITPQKGFTKIYIDPNTDKFSEVFRNWQSYFANKRPALFENHSGRILAKVPGEQKLVVFRKGIRTHTGERQSLYDYDVNSLEINESRTASSVWGVNYTCSNLLSSASKEVVDNFVDLSEKVDYLNYTEWQSEFWDASYLSFSKEWLEVIADRELVPSNFAGSFIVDGKLPPHQLILPDKLIEKLRKYFGMAQIKIAGEDRSYFVCEDQSGLKRINQSLKRMQSIGYHYRGNPPLIVRFKDMNCRGTVDNNCICISEMLLDEADGDLDETVLEEIVHHGTGYNDLTRSMQNWLFKEVVRLGSINLELRKRQKVEP